MFNFANMWVPVTYAVLLIILGGATWLLLGIFKKPTEPTTKEDKKAAASAKKQAKLDAKNSKKNSTTTEPKPAFTKAKASAFPESTQKHVFGETGDTISLGGEVSESDTAQEIEEVDANSILGISSSKTKASRAEDAIIPSSLFDRLSDDD